MGNVEEIANASVSEQENVVEERNVYFFSAGVGAARSALISALNRGQIVPVILDPNEMGRVYITNQNNNKVGWVADKSDPTYEVLKAKEPATNTVIDAGELLKILGKKKVTCQAIRVVSSSIFEMKLDLNTLSLDQQEKQSEENMKKPEIDLVGFTEENAKQIRKRLNYFNCLSFVPAVLEKISRRFVDFLKDHEQICEFQPCFENYNNIVENAVMNMLAGANLCLSGPKGTGKNKLVEHLSNLFNLKLCDIQLSYDTAKEEVRGEPTIMDDGKIAVRLSNILQAAQHPSIICLDEANMARGSITSLLHSVTDHRRYMEVPGYGIVHVHPQARFIITMNEGDEYEGTREMNSAFRDRFHEIIFEPQIDQMGKVFQNVCGITQTEAEELLSLYSILFRAVNNPDDASGIPPEYLSQRAFVRAGNLVAAGFEESVASAVKRCVVDTIPDVDVRKCLETLYSWHKA